MENINLDNYSRIMITGFIKFDGREYGDNIDTLNKGIFLNNRRVLALKNILLLDCSDVLENLHKIVDLSYNPKYQNHEDIVNIDYNRLVIIRDILSLSNNIKSVGWIDSDIILNNKFEINLSKNGVSNVHTLNKDKEISIFQSNGVLNFTKKDYDLVEDILLFIEDKSDEYKSKIDELDWQCYSRDVFQKFKKDLNNICDVIAITNYNNSKINLVEYLDKVYPSDKIRNAGINLSYQWNRSQLDDFYEVLSAKKFFSRVNNIVKSESEDKSENEESHDSSLK